MIRTVSGSFEPDSPFMRSMRSYAADGLSVRTAKDGGTVVIEREIQPQVKIQTLGFTYLGPTS